VNNGNFEDWTKPSLFKHPYSNVQTASSNYHTFVKNGEINVTQMEADDNSFMRIENISIDNAVEPGFFIFGEEPMSEGENLLFSGGFEITDMQVTGISMDMRMDIPAENPGFVIVQFKNDETPVGAGNFGTGTYVFPLSGNQDWTQMSFDFDETIDPSTNRCVIGISSAELLNNDVLFAEGGFVEVDNIILENSTDGFIGSDFEFWNFIQVEEIPDDIYVEMDDLRNPSYQKTSLMTEEVYALQLTTLNKNGEIKPGIALMGDMTEFGEVVPTAQLLNNHSLATFLYRYQGIDGDVATVKFTFYNDMNGVFQPVFTKEFSLESTNTDLFQYDFGEDKFESFPDATYMTVEFSSSNMDAPQEGSVLIVDELTISGTLGIMETIGTPDVNTVFAYPNPTIGRIVFRFEGVSTGYYHVYSPQGVVLSTDFYQSTNSVVHNLADYAAGTYTFRFYDNNGTGVARVIKH
jgi:hypothetical protein